MGLNHFKNAMYPMVPGHEMVGTVTEVGNKVTQVKVGQKVGVGCILDSCLNCPTCDAGDEQYCEGFSGKSMHSYNTMKKPMIGHVSGNPDVQNFGGYSGSNVVHEHFVIPIPKEIELHKAGPILCSGITVYDPLKYFGAVGGKPMTIGIVGIGGLGTMGIKIARALGDHHVVAISTNRDKEKIAEEKGADDFLLSTHELSMSKFRDEFDLILNTNSELNNMGHYLSLLKTNG